MKKLLYLASMLVAITSCAAPPIVMENHVQRKVFTKCASDKFCFQNSYEITWNSWCNDRQTTDQGCRHNEYGQDYPVSSRSKEHVFMTRSDGYWVTLPAGGNIAIPQAQLREVTHD